MQVQENAKMIVMALAVALLSGWGTYAGVIKAFGAEPPIARKARFSCGLRPDPEKHNQDVWTLNYHKGGRAGSEPWLYIVQEMEGGWTPQKRCEDLELRMQRFASDRLLKMDYRPDPAVPSQYVLCGITKRTPESCDLLLTLSVADSQKPEDVLRRATSALKTGKAIKQSRSGGQPIEEWTIEVEDLLGSSRGFSLALGLAAAIGLVSFGLVYWWMRSRPAG